MEKELEIYKERLDRVERYYKDHAEDIVEATEGDGSNYIFKLLHDTLTLNASAIYMTRTIPTAVIASEVEKEHKLLEHGQRCIVEALCELIDQDFEYRIRELEDDVDYYRHEMDDWRDIANNYSERDGE